MRHYLLLASVFASATVKEMTLCGLGVDGWTLIVDILILLVIIVTWAIDRKNKVKH